MKPITTIIKKELNTYLNTPTTYVIITGWLVLWLFFFFKPFFLMGEASLRYLFNILPWFLIFIVPAFTMSSFSQEEKSGTLELLLTKPINEFQLIVGKYLAAVTLLGGATLVTLILPYAISPYGAIEGGPVLSQYLGAILTIALLVSLGLLISSTTKNQILALLGAVAICFLLVISGQEQVATNLPPWINQIASQIALTRHLDTLSQGVIDIRDILYFLSFSIVFLGMTYSLLVKRRTGFKAKRYRQVSLLTSSLIIITILVNLVGYQIPGRLDLTSQKLYTLSPATKNMVANLPDVVTLSFYNSKQLPPQVLPVAQDVEDVLRNYQRAAKGKIILLNKHPDQDPSIESEATSNGIKAIQFNVISQEEYQIKKGYLGLAITYLDQQEVIPFISSTDDLEYQITSLINKLTAENKEKVVFLSGHGEKTTFSDLSNFKKELSKQYQVDEEKLDQDNPQIAQDIKTIILAGPTQEISEAEKEAILDFVQNGGSLFALIDAVTVSTQTMAAYPNQNSGANLTEELGIKVEENLIYDLASNESVRLGGTIPLFVRYPLWPKVRAGDHRNDSPVRNIESLTLPWPSSVSANEDKLKDAEVLKLFVTSEQAGAQSGNFNIYPDQQYSKTDLTQFSTILAVKFTSGGRLIVAGDSDFLTDNYVQNSPANLAFGLNAVDWLTLNETLGSIRSKARSNQPLMIPNKKSAQIIKYGSMGGVAVIVLALGAMWAIRRKRNNKKAIAQISS